MAKLDKQNRLLIPKNLMKSTNIDFEKEVRLYLRGNEFYLDNPSFENRRIANLGSVNIESKGRICLTKSMRKFLQIDNNSEISCYLIDDKVTFKKIFFIPETR